MAQEREENTDSSSGGFDPTFHDLVVYESELLITYMARAAFSSLIKLYYPSSFFF